ncbi:hypothetical protein [Undibacterium sp. Ren11W]|uniref:hypothetical protein n=1 Tax=Undibacterium sp. Ren11W TaxID=3413045 RepID=UPI003BEFC459
MSFILCCEFAFVYASAFSQNTTTKYMPASQSLYGLPVEYTHRLHGIGNHAVAFLRGK